MLGLACWRWPIALRRALALSAAVRAAARRTKASRSSFTRRGGRPFGNVVAQFRHERGRRVVRRERRSSWTNQSLSRASRAARGHRPDAAGDADPRGRRNVACRPFPPASHRGAAAMPNGRAVASSSDPAANLVPTARRPARPAPAPVGRAEVPMHPARLSAPQARAASDRATRARKGAPRPPARQPPPRASGHASKDANDELATAATDQNSIQESLLP